MLVFSQNPCPELVVGLPIPIVIASLCLVPLFLLELVNVIFTKLFKLVYLGKNIHVPLFLMNWGIVWAFYLFYFGAARTF